MPLIGRVAGYLRPGGVQAERGASAVIIAVMMVSLLSVGALTIDYGQASLTRRQTQNAADALALGIAERCARQNMSASCVRTATANATQNAQILAGNAPGARIASLSTPDNRSVRVSVSSEVDYRLAPLLGSFGGDSTGFFTDTVTSTAVARADSRVPVQGFPVLPLGVGYCTWKNHSGYAGTTTEADHRVNLRTDTLQSLRNTITPVQGLLSGVLEINGLLDSLGTTQTDVCNDPSGVQIANFRGATWLTGEHVLTGLGTSLFGWDDGSCQLKISRDFNTFVGGVQGSAFFPPSCASKFGNNKPVAVGKTILLPVYKPRSDLQNRYGFKLEACASTVGTLKGSNPMCLEVPPKIGVEVVGFAPFTVTGWNFPVGPKQVDTTVGCNAPPPSSTFPAFRPYDIVDSTLRVLERLVQGVLNLLSQLTGVGQLIVSLNCNGLQGYFTKSMTKDPDFQYGTGGEDFGAGQVRLTQ